MCNHFSRIGVRHGTNNFKTSHYLLLWLIVGYAGIFACLAIGRDNRTVTMEAGARLGDLRPRTRALPLLALLLADRGEVARAVELYALASRHPVVANSRWFEDVVGRQIAAAGTDLSPAVISAARERGRARELDATLAELLAELESQLGSTALTGQPPASV